jgi:hypothetical protein
LLSVAFKKNNKYISTAVTVKNAVFWDVTLRGSCKNQRFGDSSASIIRTTLIGELGTTLAVTSNLRKLRRNTMLLVSDNVVPSSPILVTLMMEGYFL